MELVENRQYLYCAEKLQYIVKFTCARELLPMYYGTVKYLLATGIRKLYAFEVIKCLYAPDTHYTPKTKIELYPSELKYIFELEELEMPWN